MPPSQTGPPLIAARRHPPFPTGLRRALRPGFGELGTYAKWASGWLAGCNETSKAFAKTGNPTNRKNSKLLPARGGNRPAQPSHKAARIRGPNFRPGTKEALRAACEMPGSLRRGRRSGRSAHSPPIPTVFGRRPVAQHSLVRNRERAAMRKRASPPYYGALRRPRCSREPANCRAGWLGPYSVYVGTHSWSGPYGPESHN